MKKIKYTIKTVDELKEPFIKDELEAYDAKEGLMIGRHYFKNMDDELEQRKGYWIIMHHTGYDTGVWRRTLKEAEEAAAAMKKLTDWSKSVKDVLADFYETKGHTERWETLVAIRQEFK